MHTVLRTASGKRLPVLSLLLTFLMTAWWSVGWGQIVGYDVSTQTAYGVSPLTPSLTASNVTIGGLTRGSGVVTTTGTAAASGWGGTGWNNATPAAAISAGAYITFTVRANTGYIMSLAALNAFDYRRSDSGPVNGLVQYSINNGVFTDITTVAFVSMANTGASIGSTSLSAIPALQNLPASSTVTFRIVPYGATISSGTFYIYNKEGSTDPDLSLAGTINSTTGVTFYPKSRGKLNDVTTWGTNIDGTGTAPASFSASNQIFNIQNRATATIDNSWTVSGTNSKIVVGDWSSDVTFTIPSTSPVIGTIDVATNATLDLDNTTLPTLGVLATNSTVLYSGSAIQNVAAKAYRNLSINNMSGVTLTGNVTVSDALKLTKGAVNIGGNTLTINGYISSKGTGTLSGSSSSNIVIGGISNNLSTLNFTPAANTLNNLTISTGVSVALGNALNITAGNNPGTVIVNGILTTNGYLTIKSDANGTARIGASTGSISGNITVERYIPAKPARKWTLLASPVSVPVRNGWQQQLFVTGPGTGGTPCGSTTGNGGATDMYNSNGFDDTQNDPSTIFTYEQSYAAGSTSYFTPIANTGVQLTPGAGYRVNVRGDRNTAGACATQINYSGSAPSAGAVTLSVTGAYTSSASKALNFAADNKFTLVGNPYPSELSLSSFFTDNSSRINISAWFYCGTTGNTGDVYTVYNNGQLTNDFLPAANKVFTSGALSDIVVSSGEAFFVEAKATGSVSFRETQKTTVNASGNGIYSRQAAPFVWTNYIRLHLMKQADNLQEMDNIIVRFKNDKKVSNMQYGALDATSINTVASSIASLKAGGRMAIQTRRLDFIGKDTVYLAVNAAVGNYRLSFTEYSQFAKAKFIYLIDRYLHFTTDVKQQPGGYPFSITADTLSKGNNRFMVVFSTTAISTGTAKYVSSPVNKTSAPVQFGLYPNPVHSQLHISIPPSTVVQYQLRILSAAGTLVIAKEGNSKAGSIDISTASLAPGTYIAELYFADGTRYTQKFVKQ
ncbi:T9SS type A sorting domain-containing protein [Ilyomonas limi]|uniref:T9SS type A sorting domain-containing protein n=1 Tax=Ilyomonas limi TaxID=2575867 RepID=A0A4V5UVN7_9BACT|nr:T9SS type A sorting domain-containing protein [Ilyomonas limi]TKK68203.1 T9SS type A sorting domain-containing protein [Ilyomonas limi]